MSTNDDLLLIELERLRQMLRIAAVDVSRLAGCDAGDYLHDLSTRELFRGGVIMLTFPLKKEWYEKIKSSEKTVEYREVKDYWRKRFISHFQLDTDEMCKVGDSYIFDEKNSDAICKLRLGYTNQYMTARITKIEVVDGKNTDLHINKPVYAIHLADVKECV